MGIARPLAGTGLGGVPLLYQHYRPAWAGRESELAYQLHNTPAQIWAELGVAGVLPLLLGLICFVYAIIRHAAPENKIDNLLLWTLSAGLWAYGLMALTDYQLDNLSISGTLVIYLACLTSILRIHPWQTLPRFLTSPSVLFYSGAGLVLAAVIWLIPIHRAWQLSSQGFMALAQNQTDIFIEKLTQAQKLASWEPYYPSQLGWNLGNMALQTPNLQGQPGGFLNRAVEQFKRANEISPYQEFAQSNLGWLLLASNPSAATEAFTNSARLVPAKRGVMYGLGLSLLRQGKTDLAIEAIALECVRNPLFATSPRWRSPQVQPLYRQILQRIDDIYTELLNQHSQAGELNTLLHQQRGGIFWWQGNLRAARQDLDGYGSVFSQHILAIAEGASPQSIIPSFPVSPARLLLQAYANEEQRPSLLKKAWIEAKRMDFPAHLEDELLSSMAQAKNFTRWVKQNSPVVSYRYQRAGFGVLSRHVDGPLPLDFYPVMDNLVMTTWLTGMLPAPVYQPEFDLALQPWRDNLLKQLS
jgi:tetratricopeptide (TPR) repeat protein